MRRKLLVLAVAFVFALPIVAAPHGRRVADDGGGGGFSLIRTVFAYGFILQIAAIATFAKRGGDRYWIWIIIIGGVIGAAAYFLVEGLPDFQRIAQSFSGPARRKRIAALRWIVRENPAPGNYEELGGLLIEEKKWSEAREAFDKALSSRTDSLDPFYWRGVASFELGDYPSAVRDLKLVVEKDPKYGYSRALCLLAQAQARSGHSEEASAAFDRLVQSSTAAESLCAAAEFLIEKQRYAEARELVETILARRATMPAYQKRRDRRWLWKAKMLSRRIRKLQARPVQESATA